jgi:hypothetical protein
MQNNHKEDAMNDKPRVVPNFSTFDRRSVPVTAVPLITLQARGNLSLNRKAYQELGEPETVELLYDEQQKIIGLHPVDPSIPHAYPVREMGTRGSNYYIAGKAFCDFYGIETGVARRYMAHMYPGDVLGIDLREKPLKSNVSRSRKKGSDQSATA